MEKSELVIAALQERIGQLVSGYETQIALLRAEITQLVEKEQASQDFNNEVIAKLEEV